MESLSYTGTMKSRRRELVTGRASATTRRTFPRSVALSLGRSFQFPNSLKYPPSRSAEVRNLALASALGRLRSTRDQSF